MKRSLLFVLIIMGALLNARNVFAQRPEGPWSVPVRITETEGFARDNFLVVDSSGNLHAVWSESFEHPQDTSALDTIYYATWDGSQWSKPVDIFAARSGGRARAMRLRVDSLGYLHALWVSEDLLYAKVHLSEALNVSAWKINRIREQAVGADFVVDESGQQVDIAYIVERQGIYFIRSTDGGNTWSPAETVWIPKSVESAGTVRLEKAKDGTLHIAWGVETQERNWDPDRIGYARSLDGGVSWGDYQEVFEPSSQVSIGFDQNGGVHLFWNNPVRDSLGRFHMWSMDGGFTWSPVKRVFPSYEGQTKFPAMAQDGSGVLHLVFAANSPLASDPRIFHTYWQGDHWAPPEPVQRDLARTEGPSLAIRGGNELHVIWFSYTLEDFGVWYTSTKINAQATEFSPVPPPEIVATPIPIVTPTLAEENEGLSTPTPTPRIVDFNDGPLDTSSQPSPSLPVALGILPVLALIIVVTVVVWSRL